MPLRRDSYPRVDVIRVVRRGSANNVLARYFVMGPLASDLHSYDEVPTASHTANLRYALWRAVREMPEAAGEYVEIETAAGAMYVPLRKCAVLLVRPDVPARQISGPSAPPPPRGRTHVIPTEGVEDVRADSGAGSGGGV